MPVAGESLPGAIAGPVLWLDGSHGPEPNMARDVALLDAVASGALAGPCIRLYTFSPCGVTLGRGQAPERELDLDALARRGIPWALRPTGGGAIWHEEAWTVSLAARLGPGGWADGPRRAVERTGRLLAATLRSLGVPAECSSGTGRAPAAPRRPDGPAPPCFASASRHEVVVEGRKIAGIAQRVARGAFLQQVNLLLGDAHARLARVALASEGDRAKLEREWTGRAVGAGRWLGADTSLERLAGALHAQLREELGDVCLLREGSAPAPLARGDEPRRSP